MEGCLCKSPAARGDDGVGRAGFRGGGSTSVSIAGGAVFFFLGPVDCAGKALAGCCGCDSLVLVPLTDVPVGPPTIEPAAKCVP